MIELTGLKLPKLEFTFEKMGDFLFWEGPLMSHFINDRDEDFIFKWSDKDATHHRWLVYKTSAHLLLEYFNGNINSAGLIQQNPDGFVYLIDMDNDLNYDRIFLVKTEDIPVEYMPLHDSFYEKETYEPYAEKLHAYLDLYFARQNKRYQITDNPVVVAAEPSPPVYGKK